MATWTRVNAPSTPTTGALSGAATNTLGFTAKKGNLLLVKIANTTNGSTPVSVQDNNSVALTQLIAASRGVGCSVGIFAYIVPATPPTSITVGAVSNATWNLTGEEWSGNAVTLSTDGIASGSNGATNTTTSGLQPSLTAGAAGDLVVTMLCVTTGSAGSPTVSPSTFSIDTMVAGAFSAWSTREPSGTVNPFVGWTPTHPWVQATVAFLGNQQGILPIY